MIAAARIADVPISPERAEIIRLRAEVARLSDRVEELERVFGLTPELPPVNFRPMHSRGRLWDLIRVIAKRGRITRDQAMTTLYDYGAGDPPDSKIIDVFLVHVRRYFAPHGITLVTHWGRGWSLSHEDQQKALALIEELRRAG